MDTKVKVLLMIVGFVVLGIFIFAFVSGGSAGLFAIMSIVVRLMGWLIFIGVICMGIYFLFIWEKKINSSLEVFKDIVHETKINKSRNLGCLYASGDKNHSMRKFGKIVGYSLRKNYGCIKVGRKSYYRNESIFRVRRTFDNPFADIFSFLFLKKILVRCPEDLHDVLQGDVYMSCSSLVKHGFYYYPDVLHLDNDATDITIYNEALRWKQLDVIRVSHPLIMKAMGVTPFDKKELEGEKGIQLIKEQVKSSKQ